MPVLQATVSVTNSATPLVAVKGTRRRLLIQNRSGSDVFVGGPGVTTSTGYKIADGGSYEVVQQFPTDPSTKFPWYGVVSTGTSTINVVEVVG